MKKGCDNPFLIICAASSGSTLLSNILDKHSQLACGPEIGLFDKPDIYRNFNVFKRKLERWLQIGLPTRGQVAFPGFMFNLNAYYSSNEDLLRLAGESKDLREWTDAFFGHYLQKRDKSIWGEKTGSNVYCLAEFLKLYPKATIIHIVRDGRDAINSLIKRSVKQEGLPEHTAYYHAASHWLYNVAAALPYRALPNCLTIKYEELVTDPQKTVTLVCEKLGVSFESQMLGESRNEYWSEFATKNIHDSWDASPLKGPIKKDNIGKYKVELTGEAMQVISTVKLSSRAIRQLNSPVNNIPDLLEAYGYKWMANGHNESLSSLQKKAADQYETKRFREEFKRFKRIHLPLFTLN